MITKYLINITTTCDSPKTKMWAVHKSTDHPDVFLQYCTAKRIVIKSMAETCQIQDCFYISTTGIPDKELVKDIVYDTIIFKEGE